MFLYLNNSNSENTTIAKLDKIGNVTMSEMKTLPLVGLYYKGDEVPRQSMIMCKEFGGDCFKFVKKYQKY